ncbi:phospholipid carrier-dependent glycosyltransferase, partial [Candidatus Woesearchaeota archaeon]|nr:phospholipid carrier-dependent glycosyltransferase [Candidatus Woesearchaeota archaeon]
MNFKTLYLKLYKYILNNKIIIFLLIITFLIELQGINHGLPDVTHPDEPLIITNARKIPSDPNPHFFDWPGNLQIYYTFFLFGLYFLFGFFSKNFHNLNDFKVQYYIDKTPFYLIGRLSTILFSLLIVFLTYNFTKKHFSKKAGIYASIILSSTFIFIKNSRYALPDIPMTFFLLLSFYFIYKIIESSNKFNYIFGGISLGLALSLKYNALVILPFFAVAYIIGNYKKNLKKFMTQSFLDINLYFFILSFLFGFFIGCPFCFLSFNEFLNNGILFQLKHQNLGHIGAEASGISWVYIIFEVFPRTLGIFIFLIFILSLFNFLKSINT